MESLVFDFGNTRIKWGHFKNNNIFDNGYIEYERMALENLLSQFDSKLPVIYSQVSAKQWYVDSIKSAFDNLVVEANYKLKLPFENKYETPQTLGVDRLASIAGAVDLYPKTNKLIIDSGSCITYDFLTASNTYEGGIISPGLEMRLKAMHQFTGNLPDIKWESDLEVDLVGKSTKECMLSGAINGLMVEINSHIATLNHKQSLKVILTGGHASYLAKRLENSTFAAPNLVLIGLQKILTLNAQTF